MFRTFKASIETEVESELVKKGTIYRFDPNHPSVEWVMYDIRHETFTFSKEDIIFSESQKNKYKDYLHLNPYSGGLFADGVKYKLNRTHVKGKTKYTIEVDGNLATLKLNWINKGLIEWVHGRKINWNLWQAIIGILIVILTAIGIIVQVTSGDKKENSLQTIPSIENNDKIKKENQYKRDTILLNLELPYLENVPIIDKGLFIKYYFNDFILGGVNLDTISIMARAKTGENLEFNKTNNELKMRISQEPYIEIEYKGTFYSIEISGQHYLFTCILRKDIYPTMQLKKYQEL